MSRVFGKRLNILRVSVVIGVLFAFTFVTNVTDAKDYWTHVIVMGGTSDGTVSSLDRAQYNNWGSSIPGVKVTYVNAIGMGSATAGNTIKSAISSSPDALNTVVVWGNHGVVGGMGTDTPLNKDTQVKITTKAFQDLGVSGQTIIDSCGSGMACTVPGVDLMADGGNNSGVFTTSPANDVGWTPFMGPKIDENLKEADDPAKGGNGDGVITAGELAKITGKPSKVLDPDAPVFAVSRQAMEDYVKKHSGYCGVVKPGQDKTFGPMWGIAGVGANDTKKDIKGNKAKPESNIEDPLNFKLRKANMGCLNSSPVGGSTDSLTAPGCDPAKKEGSNYEFMKAKAKDAEINWVSGGEGSSLTREQAETALGQALHAYKVPDGKLMQPNLYIKGTTNYDAEKKPVLVRRADCVFLTPPSPMPAPSSDPGNQNNGGGQQGQGNRNQPQQGQGNNQNGQPSPTPQYGYATPSPTADPSVTCSSTYDPVCDTKGQTQPNECVAVQQKGLTIKHTGVCTDVDKNQVSMSVTDLSNLIRQVVTSGIPENTITSIIQSIVRLFSSFINGTATSGSSVVVQ